MRLKTYAAFAAVAALGLAGVFVFTQAPNAPAENERSTVTLPLRTFALNVDPATMADIDSRKVATTIHSGLVAVRADGSVHPRAAQTWSELEPGKWQFNLKPGLTFTNGRMVDANAVIESLCASMQPNHIQSWSLKSIAHNVTDDGVECTGLSAPDSQTVIVSESAPTPWLLDALSAPGGWIVDTTSQVGAYGERPGIGPYQIERVVPDGSVQLVARDGGAIEARLNQIVFDFVPDEQQLSALFAAAEIDFVELDSPRLVRLITENGAGIDDDVKIIKSDIDRVHVVAFNLSHLTELGMTPEQIRRFLSTYAGAVDRDAIADRSLGLAEPMLTPYPPFFGGDVAAPNSTSAETLSFEELPALTLITETDDYSDAIAAQLPGEVLGVKIERSSLDKGLYIQSIFEGKYDVALMKVEATHKTPLFWNAFFTPGDPYSSFGWPISEMTSVDVLADGAIEMTASLVQQKGNWIGVLRDVNSIATSDRISGLAFTASGQLSLEEISLSK